jgi:hypothetical protein
MAKPGTKEAALKGSEAVRIPGQRMAAPGDLEPGAAVFWEAIVIRLPEDFFTSETVPILKAYCRHSDYCDYFARQIAEVRTAIEALEDAISQGRTGIRKIGKLRQTLHELHKLHAHESSHAISCATRLRLTNQSRFVPESARAKATQAAASTSAPPPWHDWGVHASGSEN